METGQEDRGSTQPIHLSPSKFWERSMYEKVSVLSVNTNSVRGLSTWMMDGLNTTNS